MKKLSVLLILAVLMVFSLPAMAQNPFADVPAHHWAYDAVTQAVAGGIITGFPDGTFKGAQHLTRYEVAMIIARVLDSIEQERQVILREMDKVDTGLSTTIEAMEEMLEADFQILAEKMNVEVETVKRALTADVDVLQADLITYIDALEARLGAKIVGIETQLGSKVDAVEGKVDGVDAKLLDLLEQLSDMDFWIDVLYDKVDYVDARVDDVTADVASVNASIAGVEADVSDLDSKVAKVAADVTGVAADVSAVKGKMSQLEAGLAAIEGFADSLAVELDDLGFWVDILFEELYAIEWKMDDLWDLVEAVDSKIDAAVANMGDQLGDLEALMASVDAKVDEMAADFDARLNELAAQMPVDLSDKVAELYAKVADAAAKSAAVDMKVDELAAYLETRLEELAAEKVVVDVSPDVAKLEAKLDALAATLAEVDKRAREVDARTVDLSIQMDAIVADFEAQLQDLAAEIPADVSADVAALEAQLKDLAAKIPADVTADVASLEDRLADLAANLTAAVAEVDKRAREVDARTFDMVIQMDEMEAEILERIAKTQKDLSDAQRIHVVAIVERMLERYDPEVVAPDITKAETEALLDAQKAELEAMIDEAKKDTRAEAEAMVKGLAALLEEYKDELAVLPRLDKELAIVATELMLFANRLEATEAKIDATKAELEALIQAAKAEADAKVAAAKAELEGKMDTSMADVHGKLDAAKAELEGKITAAAVEADAKVAALKAELEGKMDASMADVSARMAATKAELEGKIDAAAADADAKMLAIKVELEGKIDAAKAETDDKIAALDERVALLEDPFLKVTASTSVKLKAKHFEDNAPYYKDPYNTHTAGGVPVFYNPKDQVFEQTVDLGMTLEREGVFANLNIGLVGNVFSLGARDNFGLASLSGVVETDDFKAELKKAHAYTLTGYLFNNVDGRYDGMVVTVGDNKYALFGKDNELQFAMKHQLDFALPVTLYLGLEDTIDTATKITVPDPNDPNETIEVDNPDYKETVNRNVLVGVKVEDIKLAIFDITTDYAFSGGELGNYHLNIVGETKFFNERIDFKASFLMRDADFVAIKGTQGAAMSLTLDAATSFHPVDLSLKTVLDMENDWMTNAFRAEVKEANAVTFAGFDAYGHLGFTLSDADARAGHSRFFKASRSFLAEDKLDFAAIYEHFTGGATYVGTATQKDEFRLEADYDLSEKIDLSAVFKMDMLNDATTLTLQADWDFSEALDFHAWMRVPDTQMKLRVDYKTILAAGDLKAYLEKNINRDADSLILGSDYRKEAIFSLFSYDLNLGAGFMFRNDANDSYLNLKAGLDTEKAITDTISMTASTLLDKRDWVPNRISGNGGLLIEHKLGLKYQVFEDAAATLNYRYLNFNGSVAAESYKGSVIEGGFSVNF